MNKEGKRSYQSYYVTKYNPDIPINVDSLRDEYLQILNRCNELLLGFLFQEPWPCNLSLVWEFYANLSKEQQTQLVVIQGMEINISPLVINKVQGTPEEVLVGVFNKLYFHLPYQAIKHTLAGPNSTTK